MKYFWIVIRDTSVVLFAAVGFFVVSFAGCVVKASEVGLNQAQNEKVREGFANENETIKTVEKPWGEVDINLISKAPISYFERLEQKISRAQMQTLLEELNKHESPEEAYESQIVSLVSKGCKRVHHYTGPIIIIDEMDAEIANSICLKPYGGLIGENCDILGQATVVPEMTTVLCMFQGKMNEFLPHAFMSMDQTRLDPACALKSRAVVAYTECVD